MKLFRHSDAGYLPGDFVPDLSVYDILLVNSSAGKDSQAMLDYVAELVDGRDVPRQRPMVAHANMGRVEWPGTAELAREHATHYYRRPRLHLSTPTIFSGTEAERAKPAWRESGLRVHSAMILVTYMLDDDWT